MFISDLLFNIILVSTKTSNSYYLLLKIIICPKKINKIYQKKLNFFYPKLGMKDAHLTIADIM